MSDNPPEAYPERIGPYRILRVIGQGGMGVVYEAEQQEPVQRRVALKVIKLGMDTRQVVARFEAERQALAVMNHPNIARMLDAGTTEEGRPYFVMEMVHGEPVTSYCDRHRLTTRERAHLFLQAFHAVQHAHQKGVVHRDIKPSNILVEVAGGQPILKIIDFGIAKAVGVRLTDSSYVTQVGQIVGTPAYMSPEQAEQAELDVDTRTDVYSLGVVLYELLAGSLPFDRGFFLQPDLVFQYLLRDTEAPTPSARFASLAETQVTVARNRRTDVRHLRRELKRDLDWVVMKAMEKDRTRRYETPAAFADDVERYLRGEPVTARPPSLGYRARRFARRHRVAVSSAAVIGMLLVGGSVILSIQSARIAEERDSAREMAAFLERLFEATDPYQAGRRDTLNISQFVRLSAERVRTELDGQPDVQARMLVLMGKVFRNLGRYEEARPLVEDGLALYEDLKDPSSREVLGSKQELAFLLRDLGEVRESADLLQEVTEIRTAAGHGANDLGNALVGLGNARQDLGEYDAAEAAYEAALAQYETVLEPESSKMLQLLNNLGTVRVRKADYEGAEQIFRQVLEAGRRTMGPDHPTVFSYAGNLAFTLQELKRFDEAEALLSEMLEHARQRFDGPNPIVARMLGNLGTIPLEKGEPARALPLLEEALEMRRAVYGPDHPNVAAALNNVARAHMSLGESAEAELNLRDALRIYEGAFGPEHPQVATVLEGLARLAHEAGRHDAAVAQYRRAEGIRIAALGEDHPQTATLRIGLGRDLLETGDEAGAEAALTASHAVLATRGDEQLENLRLVLGYLVDLSVARGDATAAERYQRELAGLTG